VPLILQIERQQDEQPDDGDEHEEPHDEIRREERVAKQGEIEHWLGHGSFEPDEHDQSDKGDHQQSQHELRREPVLLSKGQRQHERQQRYEERSCALEVEALTAFWEHCGNESPGRPRPDDPNRQIDQEYPTPRQRVDDQPAERGTDRDANGDD
jgi:hypothetical protein